MRGIVICLPIAALILASWWYGAYQIEAQFAAYALVLAGGIAWWIESATRAGRTREFMLPTVAVPVVAALLLGAWHLSPGEKSLVTQMDHAEFEELRPVVAEGALATHSLYPPATRLRLAVFAGAFLALLICCEPSLSPAMLRFALGAISVNGMCVAAYGMVRKIQGSEMIYETLFAQAGFSCFINRNQAAGFLNLSIAAAVGWLMLIAPTAPSRPTDSLVKPRRSRSFSLSEFLSHLTGEQILAGTCIVIMTAGVLFTTSRGGIGALAISATIVAIVSSRRFGLVVPCVILAGGLAVALSVYLGQWSGIQNRLESLSDPTASWQGRVTHWQDTFGAVRDFPITGTGWGTYAYANLPYQRHQMELWYVNADNNYFESLVEGGVIGLGLLLLMCLLLLGAILRLTVSTAGKEGRALAFAGLMAWSSQAVQSATDFGLLRPSNSLLFAVLMGLILAEASYTVRLQPPGRWLSLTRLPGWTRPVFGIVCIAVAGVGVVELSRAAECGAAVRAVPNLAQLSPGNDSITDADFHIHALEQALAQRLDDADARFKLAELWMHRYRLQVLDQLRLETELIDGMSESMLWTLSHPATLQQRYMEHVETYGPEAGQAMRESDAVLENLRPAIEQLRLARRICPVSRPIDYLAAMLGSANPGDPDGRRSIYRSLFASPARSARLIDLGQLAWQAHLDELAMICFQRGLALWDGETSRVWNLLRSRIDDQKIVDRVLPSHPGALLELTEHLQVEDPARPLLIARLRGLADAFDSTFDLRSQGRLAELEGDYEEAIESYTLVLAESPQDLSIRARNARCHAALGDFPGANEQLRLGFLYAPDSNLLLQLKDEVRLLETRQ